MAVKLVRKRRKNADGTYDTVHYETQAKGVWFEDGQSIQEKFDNGGLGGGGSSGGSSKPDLVINIETMDQLHGCENVSFDLAQATNVYNKLLAKESVSCVVNAVYRPHSGGPAKGCFQLVSAVASEGQSMDLFFNVPMYLGVCTIGLIRITFLVSSGTLRFDSVACFKGYECASVFY